MRTILMASAALLMASTANATSPGNSGNAPPFQQGGSSAASASAAASANAHSAAAVRNTVTNTNINANTARGGNASARAAGGSASANASPSIGIDASQSGNTYLTAPPALMGAASGPCVGETASVSGGVLGVSIGGGRSQIDKECTRRETARVLYLLGDRETALRLMMAAPIVVEITAPAPVTAPPVAAPAVPASRASRCALPTADEIRTGMC